MCNIRTNYFGGELFANYGVTKSERKFIESMIKPME